MSSTPTCCARASTACWRRRSIWRTERSNQRLDDPVDGAGAADAVSADGAAPRTVRIVLQQHGQRRCELGGIRRDQQARVAEELVLVEVALHAVAGADEGDHRLAEAERLDRGGAGLR